jgi:hypothetical protein
MGNFSRSRIPCAKLWEGPVYPEGWSTSFIDVAGTCRSPASAWSHVKDSVYIAACSFGRKTNKLQHHVEIRGLKKRTLPE